MAFAMRMGVGRKKDKKAQDEADRGDVGAAKLEVALREIYNKVDTECVHPRRPPAAAAMPPTEKKSAAVQELRRARQEPDRAADGGGGSGAGAA